MKPILYSSSETDFLSNGIGRLSDAVSCIVTEAINGEFEMEISYPSDGKHAESVIEGAIIMSSFDESGDLQPFRVYQRTDVIDGVFTVRARHLAYDLALIPVMPFAIENATPTSALAGIKNNTVVPCPFTFATDMVGTASFGLEVPTSAKAALGGGSGSVIGVFGGEVKYNLWEVSVLSRRGQNKPVTIRYGENMTGLECISNAAMAYNAVVPYCKTQDGVITTTPPVVAHGAYTCAVPLNLSDAFDGYVPSARQLEDAAVAWLNEHQPWVTEKAITVHFVELWQTEEYKNVEPLQFVQLGDGVTVSYPKLGIDAVFRVVKTVFDVLQNRYSEIVLGRETATTSTMISELITKLEEARDIAQEIANGTYTGGTFINGDLIYSPQIYGGQIHIGHNGAGYNFAVDGNGNVETNGSVHLQGIDTKIVAPKILSNAFSVFPVDATEKEIEELTIPAGFNLYDRVFGIQSLFNLLNIHQHNEYTLFSSPSGGYANWNYPTTEINGVAYYKGSGQTGVDAEIATKGDFADYPTTSEVQDMIDAALHPQQ